MPVVFLKPSTSVIGPGEAIRYPTGVSSDVHHEAELAVVIGRLCREVPAERAADVDPRLHLRQRRHGPRPAAGRAAVGPRQGLRHVLPASARGSRPSASTRRRPRS